MSTRWSGAFASAALAAALVVAWKRRTQQAAGFERGPGAAAAVPPEPVDVQPQPSPVVEEIAYDEGAVPDPTIREQESAETDETKYERLVERESAEREAVVERLQADPLTEKLEADA